MFPFKWPFSFAGKGGDIFQLVFYIRIPIKVGKCTYKEELLAEHKTSFCHFLAFNSIINELRVHFFSVFLMISINLATSISR